MFRIAYAPVTPLLHSSRSQAEPVEPCQTSGVLLFLHHQRPGLRPTGVRSGVRLSRKPATGKQTGRLHTLAVAGMVSVTTTLSLMLLLFYRVT